MSAVVRLQCAFVFIFGGCKEFAAHRRQHHKTHPLQCLIKYLQSTCAEHLGLAGAGKALYPSIS